MKITREQLTFEFLEALFDEHERDPLPTHWVDRDAIWERVTAKYGDSLTSELATTAFKHLYAGPFINQVSGAGKIQIQINERGIVAYKQMKAGGMTGRNGLPGGTNLPIRSVSDYYRVMTAGDGLPGGTDSSSSSSARDPKVVFVVHGRNRAVRDSMFNFLRAIGLSPLEWSQAVSETGAATPYIGQVLDTAFSTAQAVVVLMTPDDEARLREEFLTEGDAEHERRPTGQARPNVLFEAGMAMGRNAERTVLVEVGSLRPFSDVAGREATAAREFRLVDRP